jgi:hypothetical protein
VDSSSGSRSRRPGSSSSSGPNRCTRRSCCRRPSSRPATTGRKPRLEPCSSRSATGWAPRPSASSSASTWTTCRRRSTGREARRRQSFSRGVTRMRFGIWARGDGRNFISLSAKLLGEPAVLVAILAHEIGHELLIGAGRISSDQPDQESLTDLLAVFHGFGIFRPERLLRPRSGRYSPPAGRAALPSGACPVRRARLLRVPARGTHRASVGEGARLAGADPHGRAAEQAERGGTSR